MNRFKEVYDELMGLDYVSTQQEFADRVGIARTIVSQLLNEKRELTDKHIQKICKAFPFVNEKWLRDGSGNLFLYNHFQEMQEMREAEDAYYAAEIAEVDAYNAELERKASLYEAKSQEVINLYSQLAELMNRLHEKEKEIADLHSVIQSQIESFRLLRKPFEFLDSQDENEGPDKGEENT